MDSSRRFWEKIYLENAPKLIGVCRRYVCDPELAEDLVHDAFLTAIDKQSTYTGKGNFEGWLRQIVVNTALMYLRKEKNHNANRMDEMPEKADFNEMPEEETRKSVIEEANFSDSDLLAAIDSLPVHHKLVFNLYVIEDYSHKQIAQKLNISEGTSKSHLARARKKVQEILYEKATSQKKDKTRAAVLLPAFAKANYIDSLFRRQLQDFSLSPAKNAALFLNRVNWSTQLKPHMLKRQIRRTAMQVTKFLVLPAAFMIVAFYSTSTYIHSKEKKATSNQQEFRPHPDRNPIADSVHIAAPAKKDSISPAKQTIPQKPIKKTPVVVKRTIIQTVKVQKTIQVYDTTGIR